MLRPGDEAQGSEAPAFLGLSVDHVVGRPLAADATGALRADEPVLLRLAHGRVASRTPLAALPERATPSDALGDPDALLLPALSDAHVHLVACAAEREAEDLAVPRPRSIAELLARLASAAPRAPQGGWLRAAGYDEAWLAERRHPTLAELDEAVPHAALRARHATRHASLLNSEARARVERALGPLGDAHAPRDPSGAPSGVVYGLEVEITRVVGPLDEAAIARGLAAVGRTLAGHGVAHLDEVTASNDASRVALLARAVGEGALPQRVRVYVGDADEVAPARRAASDRIEVTGVKLLARSAEEVHAAPFRAAIARARRAGVPLAVHAVEPDVVAAVLDALAEAPARTGAGGLPDRIEHASLCPPDLAARLAAARVAVVTQPAFLLARGDKYQNEVEPPLWPWLYPLATLRAAGVLVAGGSDAPVVPLDPRLGLDGAVARRTRAGALLAPEERLAPAAALELFTTAAGRLRGDAAPAGPTPGAPADLLIVEPSLLTDGFAALRVRATLRAGRRIA